MSATTKNNYTQRIAHDAENAIELILMIGIAGLDVLLLAVKDGLVGEQLGEDAADGPDVDGFGVVARAQQQLGRTVPERDHDRVEVGQRTQWRVEEARKAHVGDFDATTLEAFAHHQYVRRFLLYSSMSHFKPCVELNRRRQQMRTSSYEIAVKNPVGVQIVNAGEYLIEQRLDHAARTLERPFGLFARTMVFDYMLFLSSHKTRFNLLFIFVAREANAKLQHNTYPQVVFGKVEQQPHPSVRVREEYALQRDDI